MICAFKAIHYHIKWIDIYEFDPVHFYQHQDSHGKQVEIKLELLTDIDLLLRVEKYISGGICHGIHRYATANNKYTKKYDKKESSYLTYLDANNLYGWIMSHKLPVVGFKWK